jgi:23S rRNA pseudouridine1911/1915/1917 synthase
MMQHVVDESEAGLRIDVLVARLSASPRSAVARAIDGGHVRLNGEAARKASATLEPGDVVDFEVAPPAVLEVLPQDIPLDIEYEDDDVIVVNKPAGMVTHPAHGSRDGTLVNALLAHDPGLPGDPMRPGLVHRLDRDTSGLLVIAKTPEALRALGIAMQRRYVKREYLGLVHGVPERPRGTLDGPIARDPEHRLKYAIRADGKPSVTHYALREELVRASELSFTLETGRTHQIRVHMAALGHPIINDPVYGRKDSRVSLAGQALHAWRLSFRHPVTREDLAFEVEPPPAYRAAKEALRR